MTSGITSRHSYRRSRGTPRRSQSNWGHSLEMLFSTYAPVIDDLRGQKRVSAVTLITKARRELHSCSQNVSKIVKHISNPSPKKVIIAA